MINLREILLRETKGWERFKLKHRLTDPLADYAARNIQEFLAERGQVGIGKLVMFPKLYYFPKEPIPFVFDKVLLKDESGELEAQVRPLARNPQARYSGLSFVADGLKEVQDGETLYFPVLRNGIIWPKDLFHEAIRDTSLYLAGFETLRYSHPRKDFSILLEKLSGLIPEFGMPESAPAMDYV